MTTVLRHRSARLLTAVLVPTTLLALSGCSGDEASEREPEAVLADAKSQLDETSGVQLALTTDKLPEGVDGILEATGTGTRQPAFDGDLTLLFNNLTFDVPVVSVDGKVYAQIPGTTELTAVNPADYGAPDPANLMDPDSGISTLLTAVKGATAGEQVREGEDVVTPYTGTLPGAAVAKVIPSADKKAEFDVTFRIREDDRLDSARIIGPFYGKGDVDYTIAITKYGVEKDITKP